MATAAVTGQGIEQARRVARVCGGVGHPVRVRALQALAAGRTSPSKLAQQLGDVSVGVVAYHLRILLRAGLVERAGTGVNRAAIEHFYALSQAGEATLAIIGDIARSRRRSR